MNYTRLFIRSYAIVIALLFTLVILSLYLYNNNNILIQSIENRNKSLLMAEELKRSSEYLTAYCRYFIDTKDPDWETKYKNLLLIRNGEKQREDGLLFSIRDSIKKLGFTKIELKKLTIAEDNSNRLVKKEIMAINAIKGLFQDENGNYTIKSVPNQALARQLVYSDAYYQDQLSILKPIDETIDLVMERTHANVKEQSNKNEWLLNVVLFLLIFTSLFLVVTYFRIKRNINQQFLDLEEAHAAIEKSEKKFRFIFENSPDFILLTTLDGQFIECNPAFLAFQDVKSIDALKNNTLFPFFNNLTKKSHLIQTLLRSRVLQNWDLSMTNVQTTKTIHTLTTFGLLDGIGADHLLITWIKDVTVKVDQANALKKYQTAVEQSPAAIVITDANGLIEYSNNQLSAITGYSTKELIGKNPSILQSGIHTKDFYSDLWNTVLSNKVWKGELFNKRKDGTFFWEEATIAPIINDKQEIINIVAIKQDVTARKETEASLIENQRRLKELNDTKNTLFSIIGHDLRGPIGTLKMLLDVLISDIEQVNPKDVKKMLESVYASTSVTFDLLENLLMWGKSQLDVVTITQTAFDLRQAAGDNILFLSELALSKNQTLHNHIPEDCKVLADKNMTMTVLRNLLMNAIKFSDPAKHIDLSAKVEEAFVVVGVKDEGMGIKPEDKEKLFGLTFSTKGTAGEKGTGIGLALCKDLVEKQGGRLWVESEPGKGSTFYFTLPFYSFNETSR